jgi:hypothetical protein
LITSECEIVWFVDTVILKRKREDEDEDEDE